MKKAKSQLLRAAHTHTSPTDCLRQINKYYIMMIMIGGGAEAEAGLTVVNVIMCACYKPPSPPPSTLRPLPMGPFRMPFMCCETV